MFTHFSGGSTKSEPKFNTRHCSECGNELYADEELMCQECSNKELMVYIEELEED